MQSYNSEINVVPLQVLYSQSRHSLCSTNEYILIKYRVLVPMKNSVNVSRKYFLKYNDFKPKYFSELIIARSGIG